MTRQAQPLHTRRHQRLGVTLAAYRAGEADAAALRAAYSAYANGDYGLDHAGLLVAASTCAACRPENHYGRG
jgi:hypothetical protein